jgi:4-hydroxythreonine-4-phosphate dehydrogenase
MTAPAPIAITMGDPSGIGPEIIVKALLAQPQLCDELVIYGDSTALAEQIAYQQPKGDLISPSNPLRNLQMVETSRLDAPIVMGKVDAAYGRAAASAITRAVQDVMLKNVSAIVTAPIHKEAFSAAGVKFPGHTEMLASLAASSGQAGIDSRLADVRMMLANHELRTVLVTIHMSMSHAIDAITMHNVLQTLRITHSALQKSLRRAPRIAVAGLNPHAGEGGLFGREEIEQIIPAIAVARAEGIAVQGPFPGDTIFGRARGFKEFDVVIAMYHDQGLIPIKYMGIEQGVNVTLGLPFVRTSVDHGTAFDIAGQNKADPSSLLAAITMAKQLVG